MQRKNSNMYSILSMSSFSHDSEKHRYYMMAYPYTAATWSDVQILPWQDRVTTTTSLAKLRSNICTERDYQCDKWWLTETSLSSIFLFAYFPRCSHFHQLKKTVLFRYSFCVILVFFGPIMELMMHSTLCTLVLNIYSEKQHTCYNS